MKLLAWVLAGNYLVKTYVRIGNLMDAIFAKNLFDQVLTLDMYENPSSIPYVWCKAAYDWDSRRPSCRLIPLVSTHEDNMNTKAIETRTNSNPSFDETSSVAAKWMTIVGGQHSILEMEKLCLKRLDTAFVDEDDDAAYTGIPDTDIIDCAEAFIQEYSPPLPPHESNASIAAENISLFCGTELASQKSRYITCRDYKYLCTCQTPSYVRNLPKHRQRP